MKKILVSLLSLIFFNSIVFAQNIRIDNMALTEKPKEKINFAKDLNGNDCALVEIKLKNDKVTFEGNIIDEPVYENGLYKIFLTPNSKFLNIKYPGTSPLFVKFGDYSVNHLPSGSLLSIIINEPDGELPPSLDNMMGSITRESEEIYEQAYHCMMIENNFMDSFELFHQARAMGHPKAAYQIGYIYSEPWNVSNKVDTIKMEGGFLGKLITKGIAKGIAKVATKNSGAAAKSPVKRDLSQAYKYYLESANAGYVTAQFAVAEALEYGWGVKKDKDAAMVWYKKAADQGHMKSMEKIGMEVKTKSSKYGVKSYGGGDDEFILTGIDNNLTDLSAIQNGRKDVNDQYCALVKVMLPFEDVNFEGNMIGDPLFKTNEYWIYMPQGTSYLQIRYKDFKPLNLYFKNSKMDNLVSKNTYNIYLSFPIDLLVDDSQMTPDDFYNIGLGYLDRQDDQYVKWMTKALEHDHPDALFQMGYSYLYGKSVDEDRARGLGYLERSSELGNSGASFMLGQYYEYLGKDKNKAQQWYDIAAQQGYENAKDRKAKKRFMGIF